MIFGTIITIYLLFALIVVLKYHHLCNDGAIALLWGLGIVSVGGLIAQGMSKPYDPNDPEILCLRSRGEIELVVSGEGKERTVNRLCRFHVRAPDESGADETPAYLRKPSTN